MERSEITRLKQNGGAAPLPFSLPAIILLCVYLAVNALAYIEAVPPSLSTVSLYGFLGAAAFSILLSGKARLYPHTIWCAVFVALCGISCLYAASTGYATTAFVSMVKVLIFSFMLCNVVNTQGQMKAAMSVYSLATVVLFIYLAATGKLNMEEGERLGTELTGNANIFASVFMIAAMCSVYFVFFSKARSVKILFFAVFVTQLVALALSGGRKFFLTPIVLFAGVQIMRTDKKGRVRLLKNLLPVAVALAILWWALFNVEFLYDAIGYRMEGLVASLTGEGKVDASTSVRKNMVEKGLELWAESPVWGHGINNFGALTHWGVYAHNNYVELLCGVGLLGTVAYYAYYAYVLIKLFKSKIPTLQKSYWSLALLGFLVFDIGAVSYDSFLQHMMLVFAMRESLREPIMQHAENDAMNRKVDAT